jgi:hypothetical protein
MPLSAAVNDADARTDHHGFGAHGGAGAYVNPPDNDQTISRSPSRERSIIKSYR